MELPPYRMHVKIAFCATWHGATLSRSRSQASSDKIAVVGMACRFPGDCNSPEEFWRFLAEERSAVSRIPETRFDPEKYRDQDASRSSLIYTDRGAFLNGIEFFDASFFNISPREAHGIDPQQRLLLEVAWEALQRANQVVTSGANSCGLFVGLSNDDYSHLNLSSDALDHITVYNALGTARSIAAGRVAYHLGFRGPVIQLDTACSSALSAIHLACQSLALFECDVALAAGVNAIISPHKYVALCRLNALSARGVQSAFDDGADGYVRGEGCGVIVLKRLKDAELANDNIIATIVSSAMNHDGASNGLTAPNGRAQVGLLNAALSRSGVDPGEVGYIEAHGSGTQLGDPIEIRALGEAFSRRSLPLMVGSVKNNIGHLEAAAGVAGFQKLVMCLVNGAVPAHINCPNPNKLVDWQALKLNLPQTMSGWEPRGGRLCGGVSSFGLSGTNVHILVERYTPPMRQSSSAKHQLHMERPLHLWAFSDRSLDRLQRRIERFAAESSTEDCADIGYTLNTRREHGRVRTIVAAATTADGLKMMEQKRFEFRDSSKEARRPRIVFLFTGQGAQYRGMGKELYQSSPYFKDLIDECAELLKPHMSRPVLSVLFEGESDSLINQTEYSQPCLFVLEYCLAKLWERWGISPDVVLGHSVGELVAATVAGVMSLSDGLKLVAARGRLMQSTSAEGGMLVVEGPVDQVLAEIRQMDRGIDVAAINSPAQIVVSGRKSELVAYQASLQRKGVGTSFLEVSHAFHSRLLDPMIDPFRAVAEGISFRKPKIPLVSNVTGSFTDGIMDARYWARHVRASVRFSDSIRLLLSEEANAFIEIGPQPILTNLGSQQDEVRRNEWLLSMRRTQSPWKTLLGSLANLYLAGVKVDWLGFDIDYVRNLVVLPTYPLAKQKFWTEIGLPFGAERNL